MATSSPSRLQVLCEEPFRLFFPLGACFAVLGVSNYIGLITVASPLFHPFLQVQGFAAAFAYGFLTTALPRLLGVPGSRLWELVAGIVLLTVACTAMAIERWWMAEMACVLFYLHLLVFILRRHLRRRNNLPPPFLFVFFGIGAALAGGLLILYPIEGLPKLGENLVSQGTLLPFAVAVGSHLAPPLLYGDRRQLETTGAAARQRRLGFGLGGALLMASFAVESSFDQRLGLLLRILILTPLIATTVRALRPPRQRLLHLYALWISFWCLPLGLAVAALFPAHAVAGFHILFVGGLANLLLLIASSVISGHCDFEQFWQRNSKTKSTVILGLLLALATRVAAEVYPQHYTLLLHTAAGFWWLTALFWGLMMAPRVSPSRIPSD